MLAKGLHIWFQKPFEKNIYKTTLKVFYVVLSLIESVVKLPCLNVWWMLRLKWAIKGVSCFPSVLIKLFEDHNLVSAACLELTGVLSSSIVHRLLLDKHWWKPAEIIPRYNLLNCKRRSRGALLSDGRLAIISLSYLQAFSLTHSWANWIMNTDQGRLAVARAL